MPALPDWLLPWLPALLAAGVALLWTLLGAAVRWPRFGALGATGGIVAGWIVLLGLTLASPRQLPERLPALALAGLLAASLLAPLGVGRRVAAALVLAVGLAGAWWLAGAPLHAGDVARAGLPLAVLACLVAALLAALPRPLEAAIAALLLVAALALAKPLGPWLPLAAAVAAASLPAAAFARDWPGAARLVPALALAALIAGPVLARGRSGDWLAAAAPLLALWVGPTLAVRTGLPGPVAALLAGAGALVWLWAAPLLS